MQNRVETLSADTTAMLDTAAFGPGCLGGVVGAGEVGGAGCCLPAVPSEDRRKSCAAFSKLVDRDSARLGLTVLIAAGC